MSADENRDALFELTQVGLAVVSNSIPWLVLTPWGETSDQASAVPVILFFGLGAMSWLFNLTYNERPSRLSIYVLGMTVYYLAVLGWLALANYTATKTIPDCFHPSITKVDAIPFTVSILTTQGLGEIQPHAAPCKYLISLEQVAAFILVVVVLATAVNRATSSEKAP